MPSSLDARALLPSRPPFVERVLMRCAGQCAICRSWSSAASAPTAWAATRRPPCAATAVACVFRAADTGPSCAVRALPQNAAASRALRGRAGLSVPWDTLLQRFQVPLGAGLAPRCWPSACSGPRKRRVSAPDFIVPVPLSGQRLQERGYNQAHEIAKSLGRRLRLRVGPSWC